jgi:hypothetical protein
METTQQEACLGSVRHAVQSWWRLPPRHPVVRFAVRFPIPPAPRCQGQISRSIVQYELPFGLLGRLVHRLRVARDLEQIFDYRARRVQSLFP